MPDLKYPVGTKIKSLVSYHGYTGRYGIDIGELLEVRESEHVNMGNAYDFVGKDNAGFDKEWVEDPENFELATINNWKEYMGLEK